MGIPFLNNIIINSAGHVQFKTTAGADAGKIDQVNNDLVITNAVGDVLLGDGSSDVYIGDGVNNVDILFDQSGSIKADSGTSGVTLTLGSSNTGLVLTSGADIDVTANLDVAGNVIVQNNAAFMGKNVAGALRSLVHLDSNNVLKIKGNDSEGSDNVISMIAGGNVGIGTTSPGEKLSVSPGDNVSAEIGKSLVGNIGLTGYAGFKHQSLTSSTSYALLQSSAGQTFLNASSTESISFRINNADKMTLTNGGDVGIGTTSPGAKLEIRSGSGNKQLRLSTGATTYLRLS